VNILRFTCGAESPPFEGSFRDWVRSQAKDLKGYALGRRRHDGRYRVITWDLNGGLVMPRMPGGPPAPCLRCPCAKEAGRRELKAKPLDPRHGRRIVITCYPDEVSAPDRSPAERTGLGDRCECCEREATKRCDYDGQPPLPFCDAHYEWHVRTAHSPQLCGCPVGEHRRLT
jgi:hypothetical protein